MKREIVRWTRVDRDLAEHYAFIAQDKIEPADRLLEVAEEAFERLALMPSMGILWKSQRAHLKGVRSYPLPAPYRNYMVFYRAFAESIEVMAVLHGARDLENRLGEILD